VPDCGGQRFESPQLHQEVLVIDGGFQGLEIPRPYKELAGSSAVCDGHLAGLSASRGGESLAAKFRFPKSPLVGHREAMSVGDLNAAPISE
jgi:hypothetical protein